MTRGPEIMMKNNIPQRYEYLDAVKGLCILCITLLHFEAGIFPHWLNVWIGMFMITAFYLAAGWVLSVKDIILSPKELFYKRVRQLGVPYLWFGLLIIIFDVLMILLGLMDSYVLFRNVYTFITLRGIGTLWFLPVLLLGEWIFYYIRTRRQPWLWAAVALVITVGASFVYYHIWSPLLETDELYKFIDSPIRPIVQALGAWPIIGVGYLLGRRFGYLLLEPRKLLVGSISVLMIAFSIWLIIAPPFDIYYINGMLSNTLPVLGFMGIFSLMGSCAVTDFCTYWGRNSLILMCTHYSITEEVMKTFDSKVLHHISFSGPITLVYFAVAVLLTYPMVYLFNHRLRFMLGKR